MQRKEQEQRDKMIALSISEDNRASLVKDDENKREAVLEKSNIKDWKYSELRECINSSCDLDLLEVTRAALTPKYINYINIMIHFIL